MAAKRFTDSGKFRHPWYRLLKPKQKCMWELLLSECDHAGILKLDPQLLSFYLGEKVTIDEIATCFYGKIFWLDEKTIFIPGFIEFQYTNIFKPNRVHDSVISILKKHSLCPHSLSPIDDPSIALTRPIDRCKDKDKEKDKDKVKDKVKDKEPPPDLEPLYQKYPRKEGKAEGMVKARAQITTKADHDALSEAIDRYIKHVKREGIEPRFIKHFSTFMNSWREWLDPQTGTTTLNGERSKEELAKIFGVDPDHNFTRF